MSMAATGPFSVECGIRNFSMSIAKYFCQILTKLPFLDRFAYNLVLEACMKICHENGNLVKIGQKYLAVDLEN